MHGQQTIKYRKSSDLIHTVAEASNHPSLNVSRGSDCIANHRLLSTSLAYTKIRYDVSLVASLQYLIAEDHHE
jgi:hypothetical protein